MYSHCPRGSAGNSGDDGPVIQCLTHGLRRSSSRGTTEFAVLSPRYRPVCPLGRKRRRMMDSDQLKAVYDSPSYNVSEALCHLKDIDLDNSELDSDDRTVIYEVVAHLERLSLLDNGQGKQEG